MIDNRALVDCFRDTMEAVRADPALAAETRRMQAGTRLFLADFDAVEHPEKSDGGGILVSGDTTFHCARGLLDAGRVAVLNFANAYSPGGDVTRGVMAQEECLCRSSNLYSALTMPYLLINYYKRNAKTTGDLGTDAVIWSPGVTVFKSDDDVPVPLDEPFRVDVLTCAAPYFDLTRKKPFAPEKLEATISRRIRNILEVAVAGGADALVLGAFGCGAFNNPPERVAECFRHWLIDRGYARYFRRVVFAIKREERDDENYRVFRKILAPEAGE